MKEQQAASDKPGVAFKNSREQNRLENLGKLTPGLINMFLISSFAGLAVKIFYFLLLSKDRITQSLSISH